MIPFLRREITEPCPLRFYTININDNINKCFPVTVNGKINLFSGDAIHHQEL
jgi:hypothetical protein